MVFGQIELGVPVTWMGIRGFFEPLWSIQVFHQGPDPRKFLQTPLS